MRLRDLLRGSGLGREGELPEAIRARRIPSDAAILVVHLHGFAEACAKGDLREVAGWLDRFVDGLAGVGEASHGILDAVMGNVGLFSFGSLMEAREDLDRAAQAALRIAAEVGGWGVGPGGVPDVGMGLTYGRVISGPFGTRGRVVFTSIGAPVNTAFKLAKIARRGEVLCDWPTALEIRKRADAAGIRLVEQPAVLGGERVFRVVRA